MYNDTKLQIATKIIIENEISGDDFELTELRSYVRSTTTPISFPNHNHSLVKKKKNCLQKSHQPQNAYYPLNSSATHQPPSHDHLFDARS